MANRWKDLYRLAARNHGVITTQLLDRLEIPRSTFADHAREHGCRRRHRGVWTLPAAEWSFASQAAAALGAVAPPALISGEAGLHLLGAAAPRPWAVTVLVGPRRNAAGHHRVMIRRCRRFDDIASTTVEGLPVACVERCCSDASRDLGTDELIRRMAAACRLRLTDLERLDAYAAQHRFPGKSGWLAAMSALRGEMVHSKPEQVARDALGDLDLGLHPSPYTVLGATGRPVAEIDLAVVALRYGVEIDGPHHELPAQRRADELRDRQLRDLGWRIDRFRWDDVLASPHRFAAKVQRAVDCRRRELQTEG